MTVRFKVSYWIPYFGCPLILESYFFSSYVKAKQFAEQLRRKKNLKKGVQQNQVDIFDTRFNNFIIHKKA